MAITATGTTSTQRPTVQQDAAETKSARSQLSRDDLAGIRARLEKSGQSTGQLPELLKNYDRIDLNGDGISAQEFRIYKRFSRGAAESNTFSKAELIALRDKIAAESPGKAIGLSKMIDAFDDADADHRGVLSVAQIRGYAKAKGFSLHDEQAGSTDGSDSEDPVIDDQFRKKLLRTLQASSAPTGVLDLLAGSEDAAAATDDIFTAFSSGLSSPALAQALTGHALTGLFSSETDE